LIIPFSFFFIFLVSLNEGYGSKAAEIELEEYAEDLNQIQDGGIAVEYDPLYFYVYYLKWKVAKPTSKVA
jgi:hypothetical protein